MIEVQRNRVPCTTRIIVWMLRVSDETEPYPGSDVTETRAQWFLDSRSNLQEKFKRKICGIMIDSELTVGLWSKDFGDILS